ncbi:hypothetical protein EDC01DRAFT_782524 [Geopyxis carbonaria]|nr:hypothetical protein EDC01DRAFT_782524 [Geopyxis carbonaria]
MPDANVSFALPLDVSENDFLEQLSDAIKARLRNRRDAATDLPTSYYAPKRSSRPFTDCTDRIPRCPSTMDTTSLRIHICTLEELLTDKNAALKKWENEERNIYSSKAAEIAALKTAHASELAALRTSHAGEVAALRDEVAAQTAATARADALLLQAHGLWADSGLANELAAAREAHAEAAKDVVRAVRNAEDALGDAKRFRLERDYAQIEMERMRKRLEVARKNAGCRCAHATPPPCHRDAPLRHRVDRVTVRYSGGSDSDDSMASEDSYHGVRLRSRSRR